MEETYPIEELTGMIGEWFTFIHHEVPIEPASEPIEDRVRYVKGMKPPHEIPIRLKAMRPIDKSRVPSELISIFGKLDKLVAKVMHHLNAFHASPMRSAIEKYHDYCHTFYESRRKTLSGKMMKLQKSKAVLELIQEEGIPWNGTSLTFYTEEGEELIPVASTSSV